MYIPSKMLRENLDEEYIYKCMTESFRILIHVKFTEKINTVYKDRLKNYNLFC